jgi:hypothetical protein
MEFKVSGAEFLCHVTSLTLSTNGTVACRETVQLSHLIGPNKLYLKLWREILRQITLSYPSFSFYERDAFPEFSVETL